MTVVGVIPARYASTRFPGKPLAVIAGKPMVQHVWERATRARRLDRVVVATDDPRIGELCRSLGIDVEMTSDAHATGTDRIAEVAERGLGDFYVNVQGDEPLIDPDAIDICVDCLMGGLGRGIDVATVYVEGASEEQERSSASVQLVPTIDGRVMALSRLPIPSAFKAPYRRAVHVGLYAFGRAALARFAGRARGPVEAAESIELLRFLEYGDPIACGPIPPGSIGVDYPEDVARVEAILRSATLHDMGSL
ncbi:MAG: 3-deoxy-manno-octulosonate cytidylyltransferase [Gemmatimonadota bacterium]